MTMVIKHPGKPLIEVYDVARKELADGFYAKARLGTELPKTLQQQINEFIDGVMLVEKSLEKGARYKFFSEAFASDFEKGRILGSLVRLKQIIEGFLGAVYDRQTVDQQKSLTQTEPKRLPSKVP